MRELNIQEVEKVGGGNIVSAAKFVGTALAGSYITKGYDALTNMYDYQPNPYYTSQIHHVGR